MGLKGRRHLIFAAGFMICLLLMKPAFASAIPFHFKDKVLVLTYHHLDTHPKTSAVITPSRFESHMKALHDAGYTIISMPHFISYMKNEQNVPENAVLITFDDGYESFYKKACPILNKYRYTATNFLVVSYIENPPPDALPHMSWKQIKELQTQGMSFYSHTYNQHYKDVVDEKGTKKPVLLGPLLYETKTEAHKRIRDDLMLADVELQTLLGKQPNLLAFPYGAYSPLAIQAGKEAGIELFFTTEEGIAGRGQELIKRVNAGSPEITTQVLLKKMKRYDEKQTMQEQK
ncbi:biofilm PGA synthesis lipoprotein PgaB [Aneurinibacillus soli]|uniref:Poly-beta-1,6-N-acetyl-D-glucosamine N-deacetylase n=2 Tax=Aneurinibacillus soli TaxID=1500254 RepID=A0A0U5C418_9BACL|nr:biofilm PGA synthesis lipoprotein PgaB [Aneurinibacillus soli]BAU26403.1 Poly-beta-1,6-N-acetyl-D-glucosamine N-deacetylase precursor [Aneurinibacillus soli]